MPKDTRIKLIQALEMAKNKNATHPPKKTWKHASLK